MNVNWKVRLKNKTFWLSAIPAALLLVQMIAGAFGYTPELGELGNQLIGIVNAAFGLLTVLGVVVDPTTTGVCDSCRAMTYEAPYTDEED